MRIVWLVFGGLLMVVLAVGLRLGNPTVKPASPQPAAAPATFAGLRTDAPAIPAPLADSVVAFGLAQRGTPYVYAGISPITGFDCSGFILYTFGHFGVAVPHSTALLIDVGRPVARTEAQPGDIVVFTGTATTSTTPGHAGIVISGRGEVPLRFVHASSSRREPFVKVNQVEGSDYERRFMQVRRVLGTGATGRAVARPQPVSRVLQAVPPVAALPAREVAVSSAELPEAAPPRVLATKKLMAGKKPATRTKAVVPAVKKKPVITRTASRKKAAKATRPKLAPAKAVRRR